MSNSIIVRAYVTALGKNIISILKHFHGSAVMHGGVACRTKRNQVLFGIIAALAPELPVMNFKVGCGPARLASPAHLGAAHDCEAVGTAWV